MSMEIITIYCGNCKNYEEMTADEQRHHSRMFKHLYSFNARIGASDAPLKLNGLAVYECKCGTLVLSNCVEIPDEENDEFKCERCGKIDDIDNSIKLTDHIEYVYVCEDCHEELEEIQRRDEKHGLYAGKEDMAN